MRKKNPKPVEINASSDEGTSNSPALQTTTEIKLPLKEDKRKRKTWVWVPVVEEEKKEPENIETNSRGRAMRNSMRKATENISASLTRKPTTISSTKETKNVRRREASLINLISSATDEPESHCAVDALVDVPVTTAEEPIKEVKNEPEDDPRREASLTIVTSSATDEPESQCRINVQVTTKEEPIEVENDRGREASLKIVNSSATDEPENHCTVIVPVRTAEERIEEAKNEDENARGREAPVTTSDEPIEEEAKDEVENAHGREASVTTAEEPIEEEAENEDEDAHGREASPINISSSATENEQRSQYLVNIPLKTAEESKEDIEVDVVAVDDDEVPQNDWPAFPEYKKIEENLMLCPDAESKECKSLQCECNPSSKEKKRGMACGEECLNRLLLMECGDECRSGKYCTNKRFQNREYAGLEIFFTGPKGWGLRTKKDISPGQFIIEYMGEIIDSKEVLKRIRRYGKDPNHKHHYLMALRNGALIDATMYGNEARFINHSCEPNAATQKWTVGRQLRIGFFAVRTIHAGEEVTFNYQFERYGKKAQKCFCESPKCTGFIGGTKEDSGVDSNDENRESGDVESDTSLDSSTDEEEKINEGSGISSGLKISSDSKIGSASPSSGLMKKRGRPRKYPSSFASFLDINRSNIARLKGHGKHHHHKHLQRSFVSGDTTIREQSEVNEILLRGPLRNRDQVLEFNRLMVRVDQMESRRRMVDFLLRIDDPNILRLFVTNQGFALIRIWFVLPSFERRALQLQSQIARLLMRLPVTNKNQVDEVCIMSTLKQMLIFELPDRLIIKETLANVIDAVVAGVDGISNNQVAATSGKLGQAQILAREFEALKRLAAQLADKWGKLVDWGFKIPKKLVDSIKESTRDDSKYRPNHERHRHRSDSVRSDDREHINRSSNNRNFDRFNKIEGGSALKPPLHQQPPNWRYQRFQNHFRKFISCPQNNSFAPPQVNFNQCNRHNDHGGEDYWEDEEKRQFEEWKQFQRFPPYGTEPDIFSNPYFAMSVAGMRPPFIPPIHLPHPAQIAAAMFAISGQPPLPVQLPFPPPPPQQQEATMLPPPPPPARPTHVNTQNLSQPSSQATLPPPPPPSQSANTSAYQTLDQQKEQPNDDDNNNKTISAIPTPTKDGFPPPSITSSAIVAADNKSKEIQPINKFINIGPIKKKSKNRTKDEAEKTCNKMDDTRIPDLIMAVCSPEYNKDNVDVDKTQDSNRTIKEELMDEKINISTVEKEVEEQTIFPEQRKASERYKKSSKEVQAEMLQRRLKSLRASLGQKASQSHWPHEGVKNSSRIEAKQSDSKQSEAKTSSSKRTFSTTSSRTNSKSRSASREGRRSHYQNDREVRERRRSGERRSQYFSNRGERRTQRDERYQGRGRRFGNGQNYYRGRRQSFNNRRRFSGGSKRSYAISPERTGQNAEGKLDDGSDCEQRKRSALEEKHIHNSREVGDRLKRGNSGGIKAQLVKKAVEQQQNKVEHENILSVSEQKQRQQVQEVNKAEINTITEKLKTIVQPKSVVKSETDEEVLKMPRKKTDKRLQSIDEDISQSSDDDSSSTMSTSSTSSDSLTTSSSILAEVETKTKTLLASGKRKDSLVLDKNTLNDAHNLSQNDFMQSRVQAFSIAPTIRSIKNEIEANEKETHQSSASVPSKSSRGHFLPLKIASDPEQQKLNAELEQDSSDELDSTDMMQPPQISVSILQDPPKLDAYIHQLKEFVYFMETMRRDMHGPPPLPLGFGANALLAVQQGQQLVNIQTKHQQPSQLPVAIKMQSTSTSTTTLGVKKRTHSNDQTQGNNTSSSSNIPVIKRARIGTVSHNTPSNCSNPPIVLQPYQQSVSKNVVRQSQQHPEQFYIASSGDQPSHSNTPPEDPRISNREPILNTMYDNAFAGQSECSITQRHPQLSLSNVTTIHSASNALINQMSDCQNMENPVSTASGHNAIQSSAADPITVTKVEAAPISEADFPSTSSSAYLNNPSTTTPASANPSTAVQLVTRSGLWLIAKDTDGTPYYYHRDTRETRWDLPPGEELIDLNAAAPCNEDSLQNSLVLQQRRAEFKRQVSALVAKCIESYRKRFFPNPNDYSGFLRKITHKVLDSQEGNKELLFNIQVQKNTRRLVDDYIKHFKVRESGVGHQIPT